MRSYRMLTVLVLAAALAGCSRFSRWDAENELYDVGQHLKQHLQDARREAKPALQRAGREAKDAIRDFDEGIEHAADDLKRRSGR